MTSGTPSLTLRSLLARAVARAGIDRSAPVIAGLTASSKALATAGQARSRPGVTVVVTPTDIEAERLTADIRFFYGGLEAASDSATEQAVLLLPALQVDPYRGMTPHFRVAAARARALHGAVSGSARIVVASAAALLPRTSPPERLLAAAMELREGTEIEPQRLADLLVDGGFTREDPVDEHGAFAIRGGIVDVFPATDSGPVRLEFVGDMVETLRRLDPATQRSTGAIDHVHLVPARERFDDGSPLVSIVDFMAAAPGGAHWLVSEFDDVRQRATKLRDQLENSHQEAAARGHVAALPPSDAFTDWDTLAARVGVAPRLEQLALEERGVQHVACQPAMEFHSRIGDWVADIRRARERSATIVVVTESAGRAERTIELLRDYDIIAIPVERSEDAHSAAVLVTRGSLSKGFWLEEAGLQIYAETDIFEEERRAPEQRRNLARTFLSDLRDLKIGDLVVHVDHGIGEFVGLKQLATGTRSATASGADIQEFLELRYHGDDKLFVPVERLDLIQKYTGGSRPALDRLGGTSWEKAKTRVKKAMRDMAEELLKLYAQRKAVPGHAFPADTHWQEEFEGAFPYEPTPDQAAAIADVKRDMEASTPMDRLLCGDVGYGKTEVAMRAAFKAVLDGKQVAILAPTTVLAFQHLKTLRDRFAAFPVTVDMVSRFRTRQETKEALERLAAGRIDIIVGTHRLLSKDVLFKDLGLLVVDEEQRFGVAHKERIKQMRRRVDVLTMTATPIPRTLNMSLVGIRDMSIIETPPKDRLSIQTNVVKFDAAVIERAIRSEVARGGQVYVVHNRVESIFSIGNLLQRLVPEARMAIGHGQMGEEELERAMLGFVEGRFDILLATTIVENGLDIPNANTIIINRADRYGLAQLYQLRGRVGRSDRAAYAYLLIPPQESLSPVARKRLAAIKEFSDLGSGFRVAALDLEIRGAGNLLGGEQSGHIDTVGFEMYTKLLDQTIRELRGEELEEETRATVNLRIDVKIEPGYIPDMNQRLMVYRKVASARTEQELGAVLDELRDRYGPPPASVLNLAEFGRVRIKADRLDVDSIDREGRLVVIKFRPNARLDGVRLVKVVGGWPGAVLVPPVSVRLDIEAPLTSTKTPTATRTSPARAAAGKQRDTQVSWWTTRATAGEVKPGFTKDEVLRKPEVNPRAEGGMFSRLLSFLDVLDVGQGP
jgi:transcription-repair coupling factor (superfamily II helicase)